MWTFKKAFDRLTEAYINDQVDPFMACACFVGNLLNRDSNWAAGRAVVMGSVQCCPIEDFIETAYVSDPSWIQNAIDANAEGFYTPEEIVELEKVFLLTLKKNITFKRTYTEEGLFEAFDVTLDLLKSIHESKGEKVDKYVFTKRELVS